MSGSNAFPYKKLKGYTNKPFPGHLPIKSYPVTSAEMEDAATLPLLVTPYRKSSPNDHPKIQREIYLKLAALRADNPQMFEEYLVKNTTCTDLRRLLSIKQRHDEEAILDSAENSKVTKNRKFWETNVTNTNKMLNEGNLGQNEAMYQIFPTLKQLTRSDGFQMFVVAGLGNSLKRFQPGMLKMGLRERKIATEQSESSAVRVALNTTVAAHVAFKVEPLIVDNIATDERFPGGALSEEKGIVSVMCVPVFLCNGEVLAVVEFFRKKSNYPYSIRMLDQVMAVLDWVSSTIYRSKTAGVVEKLKEMSNFLQNVTENFLDKSTDVNELIKVIMKFAKSSVGADRCAFFSYNEERNDLSASLFNTGNDQDGNPIFQAQAEIRFPADKGIAGYVATHRVVLNIQDPYSDPRFNTEIDKQTGYLTKGILCAPIITEGKLYGVLQIINKLGGSTFSDNDQKSFEMFTIYSALAIRFMKMNLQLVHKGSKLSIFEELYSLRTTIQPEEYRMVQTKVPKKLHRVIPSNFQSFTFDLECSDPDSLILYFLYMVKDVVLPRFLPPNDIIINFAMGVRNAYRDVPYHNFVHAMHFTHCMYLLIKTHKQFYANSESLCYLVAALGHDLDHGGYSGDFLFVSGHPIGLLYGKDSPHEQHNYAMTANILAQPDSNMLMRLEKQHVGAAYDFIKQAILSTDLAFVMENNAKILAKLLEGTFDHQEPQDKKLMRNVMMPACDLCAMVKDFEFVQKTVYLLYEEFWMEGDERKKRGLPCIEMMDRDFAHTLPQGQIHFYSAILLKLYKTISMVLKDASDLEQGAKRNLKLWKKEQQRLVDEAEAERALKREQELQKRQEMERIAAARIRGNRPPSSSEDSD